MSYRSTVVPERGDVVLFAATMTFYVVILFPQGFLENSCWQYTPTSSRLRGVCDVRCFEAGLRV